MTVDGTGLALTTDAFVVTPLRFPGGSIGELAVNGTVNDLAMAGARPLALSLSLILEEGLEADVLRAEVEAIARAAEAAGVAIVTGDTKVVERGHADGMYVTHHRPRPRRPARGASPAALRPGDRSCCLRPGRRARHGDHAGPRRVRARRRHRVRHPVAVAGRRRAARRRRPGAALPARRHPRRRRLGAQRARARLGRRRCSCARRPCPSSPAVAGAAELLGIDPMYVANEGKLVALVAPGARGRGAAALRASRAARDAAEIGEVRTDPPGWCSSRPRSAASG